MNPELFRLAHSFHKLSQAVPPQFTQLKTAIIAEIRAGITAVNKTQASEIDAANNETIEIIDDALGRMIEPANQLAPDVADQLVPTLQSLMGNMYFHLGGSGMGYDKIADRNGLRAGLMRLDGWIRKLVEWVKAHP